MAPVQQTQEKNYFSDADRGPSGGRSKDGGGGEDGGFCRLKNDLLVCEAERRQVRPSEHMASPFILEAPPSLLLVPGDRLVNLQ